MVQTKKEAIKVQNLTFGYDQNPLLKTLSLSVEKGESLAILGPNGVGKTTFFKLLLGLYLPWSGEITILGKAIVSASDRVFARENIAYVPQERVTGKLPITVFDAVLLGRYAKGFKGLKKPRQTDREAVKEALAAVSLTEYATRDVSKLSGGQLQRMALARALVREAPIILLDEPVAHLDKGGKEELPYLIQNIQREKTLTMITITHEDINMEFDRILRLKDGQLKEA